MSAYDARSLEWLLAVAENEMEGPLVKRIVRDRRGGVAGWLIYYQSKNGLGRVLQMASRARSAGDVVDCLLWEAREAGVSALWGRSEPSESIMHVKRQSIVLQNPWVLVHSRHPELVASFMDGRASLTGLEGELWMQTNA